MAARVGPEPSVVLTNRRARTSHCVKLTAGGQAQSQPRSQGSLLPALRSERERETLENAGHVAPDQN